MQRHHAPTAAIEVTGLTRSFGAVRALDGIDLHVPEGSVLGLLGPNGAGKTTLVRILATLLRPDGGRAEVAGHDVTREPRAVRAQIGLTGQHAAIDGDLTGRENLELLGRLSRLEAREARDRAAELLDRFALGDAADRLARTYSGGMARRLDVAAGLLGRPSVLFLDEPTTGLDPTSRHGVWAMVRELAREGTTVLLTTQHLEEADELADGIAVIDHGRLIASGSAEHLKAQVGGRVLELEPAAPEQLDRAVAALRDLPGAPVQVHGDGSGAAIAIDVGEDHALVTGAIRRLDEASIAVGDVRITRPTLDQVFFALTGEGPVDAAEEEIDREEDA